MWYKAKIIKGKGRGKTLGFPTFNLKPPPDFKLKKGVYTCLVKLKENLFKGLLYWGPSLTFGERETRLEIHLLNKSSVIPAKATSDVAKAEIYKNKEKILFKVGKFLRRAQKFSSVRQLVEQIKKDITYLDT